MTGKSEKVRETPAPGEAEGRCRRCGEPVMPAPT